MIDSRVLRQDITAGVVGIVIAASLAAAIRGGLDPRLPGDLRWLSTPLAILLAVPIVFSPLAQAMRLTPLKSTAAQAVAAAALVTALAAVDPSGRWHPILLAKAATLLAAMTFCIAALTDLLAPRAGGRWAASGWVMACAAVLCATPLWLDWALGNGLIDPNLVVALNPLAALALPFQADLLRCDWLYRHSSLGSLRYDYPPLAATVGAYAALGLGSLMLGHRPGDGGRAPTPPTDDTTS